MDLPFTVTAVRAVVDFTRFILFPTLCSGFLVCAFCLRLHAGCLVRLVCATIYYPHYAFTALTATFTLYTRVYAHGSVGLQFNTAYILAFWFARHVTAVAVLRLTFV